MGLFGNLFNNDSMDEVKNETPVKEEAVPAEENKLSPEEHAKLSKITLATTALSYYVAACDDNITLDEYMEIDLNVSRINKKIRIPDDIMAEIKKLSDNHNITWDEVKTYLDMVSDTELLEIKDGINRVAAASDGISDTEKKVIDQFNSYIMNRN